MFVALQLLTWRRLDSYRILLSMKNLEKIYSLFELKMGAKTYCSNKFNVLRAKFVVKVFHFGKFFRYNSHLPFSFIADLANFLFLQLLLEPLNFPLHPLSCGALQFGD